MCRLTSYFTAKLIRRDPRMVERKKTGMAKARKRVWHLFFNFILLLIYVV